VVELLFMDLKLKYQILIYFDLKYGII